MELNNCQCLQLPPIVCQSFKEAMFRWLSAISCTTAVWAPSSTCANWLLLAACIGGTWRLRHNTRGF